MTVYEEYIHDKSYLRRKFPQGQGKGRGDRREALGGWCIWQSWCLVLGVAGSAVEEEADAKILAPN